MGFKDASRMWNCYSSEDNSDSDREYKIEEESSEESEEIKRMSKRIKMKKRRVLEWEEEDEIVVLKQLYEFAGSNGGYSKAFYEFVKKGLSNAQVSMKQMSAKIGRFKREYLENECRRKENGLRFSEPHEFQVFVLSKRIWGGDQRSKGNGGGMRYSKGFLEQLQEMDIDINCLTPSCLEHLKKDWEVQLLMNIQLLSKKSHFDAKLMELVSAKSSRNN